ncbi:MAG: hypothetical protein A2Z29_08135 [Chloroflexi bacterium RBG_16_56_11]|nr:MAG: hypothetical protein A2Z29_08135 [Chloroflexi bacterium RBG_16_56_11]
MKYYVGTSGWHYDDWRGRFYPEKLPRSQWLEYYARTFMTLELNSTFYRLPTESALKNWYASSPPGFVFAIKVSRFITHIKRLKDCDEAIGNFMSRAALLHDKQGPLLYQLPPGLRRDDETLVAFLKKLPLALKHAFEFRHPSWFDDRIFDILAQYKAGFCVFDMPRLTSPLKATADFAYIRFHGHDGLYSGDYTDSELTDWAGKIKALTKGLESVYIYFNNDIGGFALKNALTIRDYLEK